MNILENVQAAILKAKENRQNCPVCGAMVMPSGGTGDDEIWYDHDCECLMELEFIISSDEVNTTFDEQHYDYVSPQEASDFNAQVDTVYIPIYLNGLQRAYKKYCHNCKRPDGVNSDFSECIPDPPYKYRCKYCGHSLRTHHLFGVGKIKDMGRK